MSLQLEDGRVLVRVGSLQGQAAEDDDGLVQRERLRRAEIFDPGNKKYTARLWLPAVLPSVPTPFGACRVLYYKTYWIPFL